jgi:hypothetical protein
MTRTELKDEKDMRGSTVLLLAVALSLAGPRSAESQAGSESGQSSGSSRAAGAPSNPPGIPIVTFRFDPTYQAVAMAGADENDVEGDVEWARKRAGKLTDFYATSGADLLRRLADYAGLRWPYDDIDVYVVRDYPTLSIQYPLTIAVGSIRQGPSKQDVPSDDFLILTFAHQITHYLLDPPPEELGAVRPLFLLDHPLMEESNYRREALVNLVAYRALVDLWGADRLRKAAANPLWESYNPEIAFLDSLRTAWPLTPERPLVSFLQSEGADGAIVRLAERFERGTSSREPEPRETAPVAPGTLSGSEFGFDLGQNASGQLFVSFLDPRSPAETAGLHVGDPVLTIEGRRFDSVAEAMRAASEAWTANREVNLSVEREGKEVFLQVH